MRRVELGWMMLRKVWARSFKPTASAQPILDPLLFHSGCNAQACQRPCKWIPMPMDKLASEYACPSIGVWGIWMGAGEACTPRCLAHHSMSFWVPFGGVWGINGLWPQIVSMALRLARYRWPSGKIWEACVSLLSNFWTSCNVCVLLAAQSCRAMRYLCHFDSVSETVCWSRSHVKPMKVGVTENGTSFEGSQDMPKTSEMLPTSVRLYVKGWLLMSSFLMVAKSSNVYEQSSSNSSMEPSGDDFPLIQSWPPWTDGPPCNAIHLATLSCVSLYICKCVCVMQMKKWLLTQHKIGPMPTKCMMSTPALATSP